MADTFPGPVSMAISLAYRIDPSVGKAVEQTLKGYWGDPPAIREHAQQWTALAVDIENSRGEIEREVSRIGQHWEGPAKDAYVNWMKSLNEESISVLGKQCRAVSGIITSVAGDVSAMNGEITKLCSWFVGIVIGILFKSAAAKVAAAAAATGFLDKLSELNNSYVHKLEPRTAEIDQIITEIDHGIIGRMVQHGPDMNHPFPHQSREFADSYKWNVIGDWRKWRYS
ncbi:hypothetical protein GCM10023195_61540 [Actinoallomurus liliacearum]|uniref:WXG100 family type VII secretion target n=1 Tax=Actinoallomurus liliacearum TaxID=1080073 RepID=A0ABP8TQV1_9ACTN